MGSVSVSYQEIWGSNHIVRFDPRGFSIPKGSLRNPTTEHETARFPTRLRRVLGMAFQIDRPSKVVSLGRRDASVIVRLQEGLSCHRGFNDRLYIRLSLASRFQSYCMAPISHNELSPVDWYFIDV